jgi:hypothetical protein
VDEYYDRGGQIGRQLTSTFVDGEQWIHDRHFFEVRRFEPGCNFSARIVSQENSWLEPWIGRVDHERAEFLERVEAEYQQVWEIQRSNSAVSAVVSQGQSHRSISILEWRMSEATCSIRFHAHRSMRFVEGGVLIDGLFLKVYGYNVHSPANDLCLVTVDLNVDRVEQERRREGLGSETLDTIRIYVADEYHSSRLRSQLLEQSRQDLIMRSYDRFYDRLPLVDFTSPFHPDVPKLCQGCRNVHGKVDGGNLMICAMHPYGFEGETCNDFEKKS